MWFICEFVRRGTVDAETKGLSSPCWESEPSRLPSVKHPCKEAGNVWCSLLSGPQSCLGSHFLSHHLLFYLVLYTYKYHVCTLSRAAQMFSRSSIRALGSGNTYKYHVCTFSRTSQMFSRSSIRSLGSGNTYKYHICTLSLSLSLVSQMFNPSFTHSWGFRKHTQGVPTPFYNIDCPK